LKFRFVVILASISLLTITTSLGSQQAFGDALICTASLDGAQEVPSVITGASGQATLQLNQAMDELIINIEIVGFDLDGFQTQGDANDDVIGAHIHSASAGQNGPIVFGFINPNHDLDGDLVIDPVLGTIFSVWDGAEGNGVTLADELVNLANDGLYINIHTPLLPGGEIRGQIICLPVPVLSCGDKTIRVGDFCVPDILAICADGTIADNILFLCNADNTALDAALAALAEAQAQRDAILTTLFEFLRVFGVI